MKPLFNTEFSQMLIYVPMTITQKRLVPLLALALAATGVLNLAKPSHAETAYARPGAPSGLTITPQVGGLLVSWKAHAGNSYRARSRRSYQEEPINL